MAANPVDMLVCMTCRKAGQDPGEGDDPRPGTLLMEALEASDLPEGIQLRPVECMTNCKRGCTVTLRGGDARWTYVYGNLDPAEHVDVLVDGASRYLDAADGVVPWRERPEHFKRNCIARIPPVEAKK